MAEKTPETLSVAPEQVLGQTGEAGQGEGQVPQGTPAAGIGGEVPGAGQGTLEELRATLLELQERVARAEHTAEYFRTLYEGKAVTKQPEQKVAEGDEINIPPDEFFKNPALYTHKVVQKSIEDFYKRQREEEEQRRRAEEIRVAEVTGREGLTKAIREAPALFQGVDRDVAKVVFDVFSRGYIQAQQLSDPEVWKKAAALIRMMQGELDISKYVKPPLKVQAAPPTERPGQQVSPSESSQLTEEERELIRKFGTTEEAYLKAKKGEI